MGKITYPSGLLSVLMQPPLTIKQAKTTTTTFSDALSFVTRESNYCFQRVLAIAILSVRPSVRLSVTRVDQSKPMQARITKSSPSAA